MTCVLPGGLDPRAVYPPRSYPVTYRPALALRTKLGLREYGKPRCPAHCAKTRARPYRAQGHFVRNRTPRSSGFTQGVPLGPCGAWGRGGVSGRRRRSAQISGRGGARARRISGPGGRIYSPGARQPGDALTRFGQGEDRVRSRPIRHERIPGRGPTSGQAGYRMGRAPRAEGLPQRFNGRWWAGLRDGPSRSARPSGPSARRSPVGDWWSAMPVALVPSPRRERSLLHRQPSAPDAP